MKQPTLFAIRSMLDADPPKTEAERRELASAVGMLTPTAAMPRIIPFDQTAEILAVSKRSLTNYSARGWLKPFRPHGQRRALGSLETDVRAFMASGDAPQRNAESTEPANSHDLGVRHA